MPLLADEPTRAIVALEMLLSKNNIVPTIIGEYYYNKPPLYNWILLSLYKSTGFINEWVVRLPTVFFTVLFSAIMFFFIQKYTAKKIAFMVVVCYVTCGRILFYDSFLGLIDTVFSAFVFLNFMLVYHFDQKKKYLYLFLVTYLITTILYMLKGLPGLVFQFLTLGIFFIFIKKEYKKLFSIYNFIGLFLMISIISFYYFQYNKYNELTNVFKTIVSESTKRTIGEKSLFESIKHIVAFPFITLLNFLPWTIPFVLIFKKESFIQVIKHPFLKYIFFILIGNITIYWLSPDTVPRYLFMFLPLLFVIGFFLYEQESNKSFKLIFEKVFLVISILIVLIAITIPFIPNTPDVSYKYLKIAVLFVVLASLTFYYYKNKNEKIVIFCSILLVARIGFDWFVFPSRLETEPQIGYKHSGIKVGNITKGQPLYLYKYSRVDHDISFYITRERMQILKPYYFKAEPNTYYLTDIFDNQLKQEQVNVYYTFHTSYENKKIYLVKLKNVN